MSYMEHTIKITFTAQALGKSGEVTLLRGTITERTSPEDGLPLWRVMDTIASLGASGPPWDMA